MEKEQEFPMIKQIPPPPRAPSAHILWCHPPFPEEVKGQTQTKKAGVSSGAQVLGRTGENPPPQPESCQVVTREQQLLVPLFQRENMGLGRQVASLSLGLSLSVSLSFFPEVGASSLPKIQIRTLSSSCLILPPPGTQAFWAASDHGSLGREELTNPGPLWPRGQVPFTSHPPHYA